MYSDEHACNVNLIIKNDNHHAVSTNDAMHCIQLSCIGSSLEVMSKQ